jgi:hypothetical protein
MEIVSKTISSPPLEVQRETTIILVDPIVLVAPVAPVDVPRDIVVGHKILSWARKTL